jgi:uncharacterized membrane protein
MSDKASKKKKNNNIDENLLAQEYFHLQSLVESYDQKALTIKAWSVTLAMAGISGAYSDAYTCERKLILLLSALSGFLFWMIEVRWKTFQSAYIDRLFRIERYYLGEREDIKGTPMISIDFINFITKNARKKALKIMVMSHVLLPHMIVFAGGILLYILEL